MKTSVEKPILIKKTNSDSSEQKVIYHSILVGTYDKRPLIIEKWNNNGSSKKQIRETIDKKNRVTKLEFLRNDKLSEFGYFPIAKVTYEYSENKIIETAYDKYEETLFVDKHVAHYQSIYHLNKNGFIEKVERISDFKKRDSIWSELNMSPPSNAELQEESKEYQLYYYSGKPIEIEFYKYSYSKLDGIYPVSKDYIVEKDYQEKYIFYWMERGVEQGVKKLKSE
ncbi:hypothetical protein [uncultured Psychroserpens sp.]|uniref:hypothetical protein n=1 Tax=uncultured Psychroserpens sp. TaxID=255436 RepID=UPI002628CE23|nr:hypothetical protein [uncultured Psychroserpens sp.]